MKLLVINYEFPPLGGGAGNATACLAREWAALGHDVEILTGGFRVLPAREERDGYRVRRVPSPRRLQGQCSVGEMMAFAALAAPAALCGPRPDVVVAFFSIPSGPVAWLLKMLRGVPYIVSLRGGDVPGFDANHMGTMHALTNPLTAMIWRNAAAVVGNSTGLCQLARDFMPGLDVPEIPNGVETARFSPSASADVGQAPRLSEWDSRPGCPELLFVGRLSTQKGVSILLDALARIPAPWHLRIVGDGPERGSLTAQAATLGIAERVTFHGWAQREELPALYRAADVFVFPSLDEGMPNVVLEALASGLPIVATRIAGNDQLVLPGENGALVPAGDARAFADAVAPLLADPAAREKMGARSRALAVQRYSWARSAGKYDALFRSVVATTQD
jgi:glycosyltransferase involved in cell wall biosynthesis